MNCKMQIKWKNLNTQITKLNLLNLLFLFLFYSLSKWSVTCS
ncbi:hypothetical protein PARC_a2757 [Pseudoalteromonas arctica A 37-1-2]|uniref:Uncharacterized protein n=1 Tax=Pseudoalteromonas arctica A 37-1-2 TaxID=1117313 RepID=A0A290S4X0_9GAMM|nr:hypothetical protein PARC_a2757 [Pseudoalteromonas arctica A 37-1-2]